MNQTIKNSLLGLLFLAAAYGCLFLVGLLPLFGDLSPYLVGAVLLSIMAILLTWGFIRYEGSKLSDLGLVWHNRWLQNFVMGTVSGMVLLLLMLACVMWFAGVSIEVSEHQTWGVFLLGSVAVIFFLALMEEVMFRGYLLFKLKQAWGIRAAVYFTSIVFGLYHGLVIDSLIGPAVWGLVYAWMALASKGLVLPTMFHFALNWVQTLFNMKTKYVDGLYTLNIDPDHTGLTADQVGLIMQGIIGLVAVILIERHIRQTE